MDVCFQSRFDYSPKILKSDLLQKYSLQSDYDETEKVLLS